VYKRLRIITPFFRLTANEVATRAISSSMNDNISGGGKTPPSLQAHILAGTFAGISQALVLCPLEAYRAHRLALEEEERRQKGPMWRKVKEWMITLKNAEERKNQAYRGVGILVVREVILNILYFPLFEMLQGTLCSQWKDYPAASHSDDSTSLLSVSWEKVSLLPVFSSGILAGMVSAAIV
jgi:hypothetical protein